MKNLLYLTWIFCITLAFTNCKTQESAKNVFPIVVYKSPTLEIVQIAPNSYVHISDLQTESYGKVPCNGVVFIENQQAVVADTTTDEKSSGELIRWIHNERQASIIGVIPTHYHEDNVGGLRAFQEKEIPTYLYHGTQVELQKKEYDNSTIVFESKEKIPLGMQNIEVEFLGEGHTKDNIVAYFSKDKVLFGGCLVKAKGANKGYVGEANVKEWPNTITKVQKQYPNAKIVIPGHGAFGDSSLLEYTRELFSSD